MKCTTIIDKDRDEEIIIYLQKENKISQKIEDLLAQCTSDIIGYTDKQIIILDLLQKI